MIIRKHPIIKIQKNRHQSQAESIIQDKTITLDINNSTKTITSIHGNEKALILGYLTLHSHITSPEDITQMTEENGHYIIRTTPIKKTQTKKTPPTPISPLDIFTLTAYFQEQSLLYRQLGLCESMALATPQDIHFHAEDLTPITALYKVIGLQLLDPHPTPILLTSSPIQLDWLKLAAPQNIKIIVSRASATYQCVEYAEKNEISLVSFARGMKCSILTHPKQIDIRRIQL